MIYDQIIETYKLREDMIKAQGKLTLQAQAILRRVTGKGKEDNVSGLLAEIEKDTSHPYYMYIFPHLMALEPLEMQRKLYEKELVKLIKQIPVYEWVKSVKYFGDMGFACIIGEAGDLTRFTSVKALQKRFGLTVMAPGMRQGNPGKGATAEDWITHGYSPRRRSVMWNVGNSIIGSMGKFRPNFGEDLELNDAYTVYQKIFAERCRLEQIKLGKEITQSKTGKESYSLHAANRAKRYVEKALLRDLYFEFKKGA